MWWTIAVWLTATILGELLRPEQRIPKAASIDDFQFPTATADRKIPVVAGTVQISGPNLVWYGDYRVSAITAESGGSGITGLFGGGDEQVVGYRYYAGMHFVLCHGPIDAFKRISFEKKDAWVGSIKDGTITIDEPELFGDKDSAGGVEATVDFHSGEFNQSVNAYLDEKLGNGLGIPAWRGLAYLVWHTPGYVGNSPYLRPMVFEVERFPRPLNSGKHNINGDANPAELLYELHINYDWGAGMAPGLIDKASFISAANKLHSEGLGISAIWNNQATVEDIARQILEHIDGIIYSDEVTGKRVLKLIRNDYVISNLPVLDPSNVISLDKFSRGAWDETTNEVVVSYTDRADGFVGRTITAQDLANQHIQAAVVSVSLDFQGASNSDTAGLIAWRELRMRSQPMAQATVQTNRMAGTYRPGDPIRFTWPELGITDMVLRVAHIRYGELTNGRIQIDLVQDLFGIGDGEFTQPSIYAPAPPSQWTPISQPPSPAPNAAVIEAPYWWIAGDPAVTDKDTGNLLTVAQRPGGDAEGYEVWTRRSTQAFERRGVVPMFTQTAVLAADLAIENTSTILLSSAIDFDLINGDDRVRGETLIIVEGEWIAYDPAQVTKTGPGAYTLANVWRGVLDTVPAAHSSGARVWLVWEGSGTTADSYPPTDVVDSKLLTITSQGTLPIASAGIITTAFDQRTSRPYAPGNVQINGEYYPIAILGAYTISWAHRDRLTQTNVTAQTNASIGPESGTTYTLRLYGETDTLLRTETGLTGTSYTWSDEETDTGITIPGSSGSDYDAEVLADAPLAYWRFDETSGSTAIDSVGGYNGTYTGGYTLGQPGIPSSGRPSVSLNGTSGYINCGAPAALKLTAAWTLEAWVYLTGTPSGCGVITELDTGSSNPVLYELGFGIDQGTGSTLRVGYYTGGPTWNVVVGPTLSLYTWHQIIGTWDGTTLRLYADGAEVASGAQTPGPVAGMNGIRIGVSHSATSPKYFPGKIDEAAIYNYALAPSRVSAKYTAGSVAVNRLNGSVRAEIESVRSGLTSHQAHNISVDRAGWGYNWDKYWDTAP
jgi:hypothetical protein